MTAHQYQFLYVIDSSQNLELPKGNCKVAWDSLENKFAPQLLFSILKLKSEFHISKLELTEKDQDLEGFQI